MSLILSSALLRAILTNYHAHDQATKAMKGTEANLRAQVNDLENAAGNLQAELRKIVGGFTTAVPRPILTHLFRNRSRPKRLRSANRSV
jgi:hypothetical protein